MYSCSAMNQATGEAQTYQKNYQKLRYAKIVCELKQATVVSLKTSLAKEKKSKGVRRKKPRRSRRRHPRPRLWRTRPQQPGLLTDGTVPVANRGVSRTAGRESTLASGPRRVLNLICPRYGYRPITVYRNYATAFVIECDSLSSCVVRLRSNGIHGRAEQGKLGPGGQQQVTVLA